MKADFSSVFPSPFPAGELSRGLAGITVRFAAPPTIRAVSKGRPVATVPQPMVRLVGLTNRQSLLDSFIGKVVSSENREVESKSLKSAANFVEDWLDRNRHSEGRRKKAKAALTILHAHQETEEVLFVLRNALIAV